MAVAVILLCARAGAASDLIYQPVNPSFGGNPFNSAHLLGIANAQNDFEAPRGASALSAFSNSPADQFVRQLQSRLLSALADQVTDALFPPDPKDQKNHGEIVFGNQSIEFTRGIDEIRLVITDTSSGSVTQVSVPNLVVP